MQLVPLSELWAESNLQSKIIETLELPCCHKTAIIESKGCGWVAKCCSKMQYLIIIDVLASVEHVTTQETKDEILVLSSPPGQDGLSWEGRENATAPGNSNTPFHH